MCITCPLGLTIDQTPSEMRLVWTIERLKVTKRVIEHPHIIKSNLLLLSVRRYGNSGASFRTSFLLIIIFHVGEGRPLFTCLYLWTTRLDLNYPWHGWSCVFISAASSAGIIIIIVHHLYLDCHCWSTGPSITQLAASLLRICLHPRNTHYLIHDTHSRYIILYLYIRWMRDSLSALLYARVNLARAGIRLRLVMRAGWLVGGEEMLRNNNNNKNNMGESTRRKQESISLSLSDWWSGSCAS